MNKYAVMTLVAAFSLSAKGYCADISFDEGVDVREVIQELKDKPFDGPQVGHPQPSGQHQQPGHTQPGYPQPGHPHPGHPQGPHQPPYPGHPGQPDWDHHDGPGHPGQDGQPGGVAQSLEHVGPHMAAESAETTPRKRVVVHGP